MRNFDPVKLGEAETDAWVGYYRQRWSTVLLASVTMVRVGFGMSWPNTLRGAWWVLRANQLWAPFPDNDPDGARTLMRRFYALVARTSRETFDVDEAARLEVEWWRVHRALQHEDRDTDPAALTDAFMNLYAHVYRVPPESVREAAAHRAEATRISDQWVADGCDPDSPAIAAERAELISGYTALRLAVAPAKSALD
jgi:hypothetical protein